MSGVFACLTVLMFGVLLNRGDYEAAAVVALMGVVFSALAIADAIGDAAKKLDHQPPARDRRGER